MFKDKLLEAANYGKKDLNTTLVDVQEIKIDRETGEIEEFKYNSC